MKIKYAPLIVGLFLYSCGSKNKINEVVSYKDFNHQFKKELILKCIKYNATDGLNQEIIKENKSQPYFYPPPPYYLKQFSSLQDSIIRNNPFKDRVLINCFNNFETNEISTLIKKSYNKKIVDYKAEGNDGL